MGKLREKSGKEEKKGKGEKEKRKALYSAPNQFPATTSGKVVSRPHLVDKAPRIGNVQEKPCR